MNLTHLKYVVEVEKTGSITKAAENLFMGQPNLSKAIKELEASLGISIFKRTPSGVVPTSAGQDFLSYAHSVLKQIAEMESLYRPADPRKVNFSLCIPRASYMTYAFTNFIRGIDRNMAMNIRFLEINSMEAISRVAEREYRIAIIRFAAAHEEYFLRFLQEKQLGFSPVWEFEYLALMAKGHPLAARPEVSLFDLLDCIEITHGDNAIPTLPQTDTAQPGRGQAQKRVIYVKERGSQFDLLSRVPETYMWVSPLPQSLLERQGLVQRRCAQDTGRMKDILIYPGGYRLTALDQAFLKELYAVRDSLEQAVYRNAGPA